MCEQVTCKTLYAEQRSEAEYSSDGWKRAGTAQEVSVRAVRYEGLFTNDVVFVARAVVDDETMAETRDALDGFTVTDNEVIRMAIAKFDDLLAGHPTLAHTAHTAA